MYKALSLQGIGHPVPLKESAPVAAKYGFKGIWLDPLDMSIPASETRKNLEENGLVAAGFNLPVQFRADEETFRQGMEKLDAAAKYAAECGTNRCMTWIVSGHDELTYEENFELHRSRLTEACKVLEKYGIVLGLEYCGPISARKDKKYEFVHDLDGILSLAAAINASGVSNAIILLDAWHWEFSHQVHEDSKKVGTAANVVAAHINDAPAGIPEEEQIDVKRALPGTTGVLNIGEFFSILKELDYDGPVLAEPFDRTLHEMRLEDAVKRTSETIDSVWPK